MGLRADDEICDDFQYAGVWVLGLVVSIGEIRITTVIMANIS